MLRIEELKNHRYCPWRAKLAVDHPEPGLRNANGLVAGVLIELAETEELLIEKLAENGWTFADGEWSYERPERLRSPFAPFADPDGVERLGPV